MPPLPVVSGKEARKAFENAGWQYKRRARSNHMLLTKEGVQMALSVPDHKKLDRGLLRGLIRDSGLTVQEFIDHLG